MGSQYLPYFPVHWLLHGNINGLSKAQERRYGKEVYIQYRQFPYTYPAVHAMVGSIILSYGHTLIPGKSRVSITARHLYAFASGAFLYYTASGVQGLLAVLAQVAVAFAAMHAVPEIAGYVTFATNFALMMVCHEWLLQGDPLLGTLMGSTLQTISCAMDFQDGRAISGSKPKPLTPSLSANGERTPASTNDPLSPGTEGQIDAASNTSSSSSKRCSASTTSAARHGDGGAAQGDTGGYRSSTTSAARRNEHAMYRTTELISEVPSVLELLGFTFNCGVDFYGPVSFFHDYKTWSERRAVWDWSSGHVRRPSVAAPLTGCLLQVLLAANVEAYVAAQHNEAFFIFPEILFALPLWRRCLVCYFYSAEVRWRYYTMWGLGEASMIANCFNFTGWRRRQGTSSSRAASFACDGQSVESSNTDKNEDSDAREEAATSAEELRKGARAEGRGDFVPAFDRNLNCHALFVEFSPSLVLSWRNWNMSVTRWLRTYAYERVTPKGQKPGLLQTMITMNVSAFWHGASPGFYIFFVSQALAMHSSKIVFRWNQQYWPKNAAFQAVYTVLHGTYTALLVAFTVPPFKLGTVEESMVAWRAMNFFGLLIPIAIISTNALLQILGPRQKTKSD